VQDALAAVATDPGAPVGLGLPVRHDRDRAIHSRPAVAVTMLRNTTMKALISTCFRKTTVEYNGDLRLSEFRDSITGAKSRVLIEVQ
jgi:hypothetical protein